MVNSVSIVDSDSFYALGSLINKKFDRVFDLSSLIDSDYDYVFGYYDDGNLLGFIHVNKLYEVLDIVNIVVSIDNRRKGIANKLMNYVIDYFNDVDKILLEVNENNIPAIDLYKKLNFNIINIRKNYYGNESALIMERDV